MKKITKFRLSAVLLAVTFALGVSHPSLAAYNPNGFTLRQDVMQDALHDRSNYDASRYQNYINNDYNQKQYVEDNGPGLNTLNSGVSQNQSDMSVYIGNVTVDPSEILKPEELSPIISSISGRNVSMSDIQNAVNEINKLYASRGFVTARAYIPEQTISDGNLRIGLIESKVGNVTVNGNRWTRTKYITDRVAQPKDSVFDIVELEKDVVSFNRYNEGVSLKANLRAGQEPGTTDIEINADEKFPFHLVGVMDNAGRYQTGHIRGGAMLYADSLFHIRDKMSLGSYFSGGATSPFFDYNIPVNKKDGRVGFLFSSTFAKVKYGPYKGLDLRSHGYQYSLYYSQPWIRKPDFEFGTYLGLNYKRSTMLSDVLGPLINSNGRDKLSRDEVTSADIAFNIRKDTKRGIWYLNQDFYYAFPIFDSASNYLKISGGITRLHDFSHGIIAQLRSNYQVIPNNKYIPYLDQMQTGGLFTVRGYNEGIMLGKNGYFMSGELIFPIMPSTIKMGSKEIPFLGRVVKGALFADHAGIFPRRAEDYYRGSYFLASIGCGLRVQLPGSLTGRLYWGFPLISNRYETDRKYGRFHFELSLAPDFDALLRKRSTAQPEEKRVKAQPAPQAPVIDDPVNNYPDVRHYDYFFDMPGSAL
ncbi:ShlB/FhaC/HecB family hemolysin secretion/activation protein [bacterium]|nr:ShlB/FhaC/HecB family hemolysin secretion/activation protein [bacterium]